MHCRVNALQVNALQLVLLLQFLHSICCIVELFPCIVVVAIWPSHCDHYTAITVLPVQCDQDVIATCMLRQSHDDNASFPLASAKGTWWGRGVGEQAHKAACCCCLTMQCARERNGPKAGLSKAMTLQPAASARGCMILRHANTPAPNPCTSTIAVSSGLKACINHAHRE